MNPYIDGQHLKRDIQEMPEDIETRLIEKGLLVAYSKRPSY